MSQAKTRGRSHYLKRSYLLPPELNKRIEQEALKRGVDKSLIVRNALYLYFEMEAAA